MRVHWTEEQSNWNLMMRFEIGSTECLPKTRRSSSKPDTLDALPTLVLSPLAWQTRLLVLLPIRLKPSRYYRQLPHIPLDPTQAPPHPTKNIPVLPSSTPNSNNTLNLCSRTRLIFGSDILKGYH